MSEVNKQTVLIVDDNRDAADTLASLLRLAGHDVSVAYDTQAGFDIAHANVPTFIFHDIGMPEISGYDAARHFRKNDKFSNTVLVAFTAYDTTTDRRRSKDAGFDIHLAKPVELDDLTEALRHSRRH